MSCTRDNKSGKWIARFYYSDYKGNRKQAFKRGFNTKKEAQEYEREFINKQQFSNQMTFRSLYELYIEDMKHRLKERTIMKKENIFKNKILPFFENLELENITPILIRKWQNEELKNLATSSVKIVNSELSTIMNYAYKFYNLKENPCKKAGTVGDSKPRKEFNILTLEQFYLFLDQIDLEYYKVLFKMLFFTGMKIGELTALTLGDIDFKNNTISINKTYFEHTKKITTVKTKSSERVIDINESLKNDIETFTKKLYHLKKSSRIFEVSTTSMRYQLFKGLKKAKLEKMRLHDFRHSHATMLIYNGINIVNVSKRLGHSDVTMTLKRCSHLYEDEDKNIITLLKKLSK